MNPVLYYVLDKDLGRIVAVAPYPLREEDRLPEWEEMRINDSERAMFIEQDQSTDSWFVFFDEKTQVRRLKPREQVVYRNYSNLNYLNEAQVGLSEADLYILRDGNRVYLSYDESIPLGDRRGKTDFWLTQEQNPSRIIAHRQVDMSFSKRCLLFLSNDSRPTTIYTNSRFQRISDVRHL